MRKSELIEELARTLDVKKLLKAHPEIDEDALAAVLREAAASVGGDVPAARQPAFEFAAEAPPRKAGRLVMFTDGASRGNPGEAGIGVVIKDEGGKVIKRLARYLGRATNNQAEYTALLDGLKAAKELGAEGLQVYADSELLVKQIKGEYRVKNPELQKMNLLARSLIEKFPVFVITYIPREKNSLADSLANEAIDKKL